MLRDLEIRSTEDLILAREAVREFARRAGCDPVIETRLVAGLSALAERFFHGACGRLLLNQEGSVLEAVLEHSCDGTPQIPRMDREKDPEGGGSSSGSGIGRVSAVADPESLLLAVGSVRFMWDEVDVCPALSQGLKVVLRTWLK